MDRQYLRYLQISFQLMDLLMLNIVIIVSKYYFSSSIPDLYANAYLYYLIFLNVSWIGLAWINRVYSIENISSFESFAVKTKGLFVFWLSTVMIYLFFSRQVELSRFFIISSLGAFIVGLALNRFLYIVIRDVSKKSDHFTKRILILGYNDLSRRLSNKLEQSMNNKIIGFIEDPLSVTELTPYPIIGDLDQTISISQDLKVNLIFSTVSPEQNKYIYSLMQEAESKFIHFRIIPDLTIFIKRSVHVEFLEGLPMIALRREPLEDIGNRIKKRTLDIIISLLVVVFVLSWLIPLLGLLIYLESPGPVIFSQFRSGRNNKPFKCLKFRSMKINNETESIQAKKYDSRFTKIGRIIRKTSLDEFPQFINVLKGEMSLVGPRPHMLTHTEQFSKIVEQYMLRQFLKPGITGWAQIHGLRGEIQDKEQIKNRVECDIWYSEYWTLWLDIRILFLTAYNIFKGDKNAY